MQRGTPVAEPMCPAPSILAVEQRAPVAALLQAGDFAQRPTVTAGVAGSGKPVGQRAALAGPPPPADQCAGAGGEETPRIDRLSRPKRAEPRHSAKPTVVAFGRTTAVDAHAPMQQQQEQHRPHAAQQHQQQYTGEQMAASARRGAGDVAELKTLVCTQRAELQQVKRALHERDAQIEQLSSLVQQLVHAVKVQNDSLGELQRTAATPPQQASRDAACSAIQTLPAARENGGGGGCDREPDMPAGGRRRVANAPAVEASHRPRPADSATTPVRPAPSQQKQQPVVNLADEEEEDEHVDEAAAIGASELARLDEQFFSRRGHEEDDPAAGELRQRQQFLTEFASLADRWLGGGDAAVQANGAQGVLRAGEVQYLAGGPSDRQQQQPQGGGPLAASADATPQGWRTLLQRAESDRSLRGELHSLAIKYMPEERLAEYAAGARPADQRGVDSPHAGGRTTTTILRQCALNVTTTYNEQAEAGGQQQQQATAGCLSIATREFLGRHGALSADRRVVYERRGAGYWTPPAGQHYNTARNGGRSSPPARQPPGRRAAEDNCENCFPTCTCP